MRNMLFNSSPSGCDTASDECGEGDTINFEILTHFP